MADEIQLMLHSWHSQQELSNDSNFKPDFNAVNNAGISASPFDEFQGINSRSFPDSFDFCFTSNSASNFNLAFQDAVEGGTIDSEVSGTSLNMDNLAVDEMIDFDYFFKAQDTIKHDEERNEYVSDLDEFETLFEDMPSFLPENKNMSTNHHHVRLKNGSDQAQVTTSFNALPSPEIIQSHTVLNGGSFAFPLNTSCELLHSSDLSGLDLNPDLFLSNQNEVNLESNHDASDSLLSEKLQNVLREIEEKRVTSATSSMDYTSSSPQSKGELNKTLSSDDSLDEMQDKYPPSFKSDPSSKADSNASLPSKKRNRKTFISRETGKEKDGSRSSSEKGCPEEALEENALEKDEIRKVRNREAAFQSRQRKKSYMVDMQNRCSYYESQIKSLRQLVSVTSMENNMLRGELLRYQTQMSKADTYNSNVGANEGEAKNGQVNAYGPSFPLIASVFTTVDERSAKMEEKHLRTSQLEAIDLNSCAVKAEPAALESDSLPLESLLPNTRVHPLLASVRLFFILLFLSLFSTIEDSRSSLPNVNTIVKSIELMLTSVTSFSFGKCLLDTFRVWGHGAWRFRWKKRMDTFLVGVLWDTGLLRGLLIRFP